MKAPVRTMVLASILLATGLAGCIGDDAGGDTAPQATAAGPTGGPGGANVTDEFPENATATSPDDLTGGGAPHIHDYWGQASRIVLFEGPVTMQAMSGETFWSVFARKDAALGGAAFEFPEGTIVYEGAGALEVTATWTDATITGIDMGYKPPAEPETLDSYTNLASLENGVTLEIALSPEMTDMPHETTSRWSFRFVADGPGVAEGSITLKFEIVKMRNVEVFPGHPDMYEDTDNYVLADKAFVYQNPSFTSFMLDYAAGTRREVLTPDEIVPMETRFLIVDLMIDSADASAPVTEARGIDLVFRGADGARYWGQLLEEDGNHYVFGLTVDDSQADSPYAETSAWRFGPLARQAVTGTDGISCQFCLDLEVKGHAVITAYDVDPTGGQIQPNERFQQGG